MPLWLIIVIVVFAVLIAGGIYARFRQLARSRPAFERALAQVDHDLAAAAASDRGWDRSLLEDAAHAKDAGAVGDKVTYAKDIAPLLKDSCVRCHQVPKAGGQPPGAPGGRPPGAPGGGPGGPGGGPRGPAGGLRLDDKAQIMKGGKHGKAVVPGKAEQSLLYKVLKEDATVGKDTIHAMPKAKPGQDFQPLADDQIEMIKNWIDQGAK